MPAYPAPRSSTPSALQMRRTASFVVVVLRDLDVDVLAAGREGRNLVDDEVARRLANGRRRITRRPEIEGKRIVSGRLGAAEPGGVVVVGRGCATVR
jgi:hypothetical protein